MLIVLGIAAIVVSIAAPNMSGFLRNNAVQSETFEALGAIKLARAEAMRRRRQVILCRSADPTAATPACGGTNNVWTTGYLLFVSGDTNSTFEPATDQLLKVGPPVSTLVDVRTSAACNRNLEYRADGTTDEGGATCFMSVCDARGDDFGRLLRVFPSGRVDVVNGATDPIDCGSPGA